MNGAEFVATVRLTKKDGTLLADVGDKCGKVPASSLPWLIEQGVIQKAPSKAKE